MDPVPKTVVSDSNSDHGYHFTSSLSHDNAALSGEQMGNPLASPSAIKEVALADTRRPDTPSEEEGIIMTADVDRHSLVLENGATGHPLTLPERPMNVSALQFPSSAKGVTAREQEYRGNRCRSVSAPTSDDSQAIVVPHKPLSPRSTFTVMQDGRIVSSRPLDTAGSYLQTTAPCLLERYYLFRREAKTTN